MLSNKCITKSILVMYTFTFIFSGFIKADDCKKGIKESEEQIVPQPFNPDPPYGNGGK